MLKNPIAVEIYEEFSKDCPIVDYHCHLKPDEIYQNKKFENITEAWLAKDHYKWRLMRANGIEEKFITGDASDKEKFFAWAKTIERCIGNPLYHWTHMELQQFFDIDLPLNQNTAEEIWNAANEKLGKNGLGAQDFIRMSKVSLIGTTDSPLSSLELHQKIRETITDFKVVPTFRIDQVINIENITVFAQIEKEFSIKVDRLDKYIGFLSSRVEYFDSMGCKAVDYGPGPLNWSEITTDPAKTFEKLYQSQTVDEKALGDLKLHLLEEVLTLIQKKNWVFQLHYGAVGSVNNEAKKRLGTGTGFDMIMEQGNITESLLVLFNHLNDKRVLPKTILYNIDGTKNNPTETLMACFQDNEMGIRGKIQHGPAWWFQDTLRGNRRQIEDLSEQGILMNFVGMTTDSRSFLSYARHDYFRRILCDCLGTWVENGEMPNDKELLKNFILDVNYRNAQNYFEFEERG